MRESDLVMSRRRFLLTTAKAAGVVAGGLIVGPEVFDMLDRMGPRRVLVSAPQPAQWVGTSVYWEVVFNKGPDYPMGGHLVIAGGLDAGSIVHAGDYIALHDANDANSVGSRARVLSVRAVPGRWHAWGE